VNKMNKVEEDPGRRKTANGEKRSRRTVERTGSRDETTKSSLTLEYTYPSKWMKVDVSSYYSTANRRMQERQSHQRTVLIDHPKSQQSSSSNGQNSSLCGLRWAKTEKTPWKSEKDELVDKKDQTSTTKAERDCGCSSSEVQPPTSTVVDLGARRSTGAIVRGGDKAQSTAGGEAAG